MNQKELRVRSCLMANPDPQLLFSHTYLSFPAHPRAQSRCRCHSRPERLLLRARGSHTARSSGLASSKANQPNKKRCFLLTSDDLKLVYRLKRQKKHMRSSEACCRPCGLSSLLGERFWKRKITPESPQCFSYFSSLAKSSSAEETPQGAENIFSFKKRQGIKQVVNFLALMVIAPSPWG